VGYNKPYTTFIYLITYYFRFRSGTRRITRRVPGTRIRQP